MSAELIYPLGNAVAVRAVYLLWLELSGTVEAVSAGLSIWNKPLYIHGISPESEYCSGKAEAPGDPPGVNRPAVQGPVETIVRKCGIVDAPGESGSWWIIRKNAGAGASLEYRVLKIPGKRKYFINSIRRLHFRLSIASAGTAVLQPNIEERIAIYVTGGACC